MRSLDRRSIDRERRTEVVCASALIVTFSVGKPVNVGAIVAELALCLRSLPLLLSHVNMRQFAIQGLSNLIDR